MSNEIDKILKRSGTVQPQRFLEALDPLPSIYTIYEDWLLFAYQFAEHVNFFAADNDQNRD